MPTTRDVIKMADKEVGVECSSHISVKSKGNNDMTIFKRCREYVIQLKDALDEFISIRTVNELVQKESISYASSKSTWGIELDSTYNNGDPAVNSEWALVTTKNHMVKSQKRYKSASVKSVNLSRP